MKVPIIEVPSPEGIARYYTALANMQQATDRAFGIAFDMIMADAASGLGIGLVTADGVKRISPDDFYKPRDLEA